MADIAGRYVLKGTTGIEMKPPIYVDVTYETTVTGSTMNFRFHFVTNTHPNQPGAGGYNFSLQAFYSIPAMKNNPFATLIKQHDMNLYWDVPYDVYSVWYTVTVDPKNPITTIELMEMWGLSNSIKYFGSEVRNGTITGKTPPIRGTVTTSPASGVFEAVTVNWSGFQNGAANTITKYEVWAQESANNSSWGARFLVASVGVGVASYQWTGGTRGYYYRFNVVATGSSGDTSDANTYTGSTRKNSLPNAPVNPRYQSPTAASDGTAGSTKAYVPESAAAFLWDAGGDPDGQAVTYEIQPLARNADNTAWINDGGVLTATGTGYNLNISTKPRGMSNGLELTPLSLSYQVRAKDALGAVSAWVTPNRAYQRNPTIANVGVSGAYAPGIAFVGIGGKWVKSEIYTGINGQWQPCKDRDY